MARLLDQRWGEGTGLPVGSAFPSLGGDPVVCRKRWFFSVALCLVGGPTLSQRRRMEHSQLAEATVFFPCLVSVMKQAHYSPPAWPLGPCLVHSP